MDSPLRIPGYRIESAIARGAQGAVYRATQLSLDRVVALKIVPNEGDETGARLLAKEAKVLAGLDHPNIVRVYDHGQTDVCSFMAMELLEGLDLERHLDALSGGEKQQAPKIQESDATVAIERRAEETVQLDRDSAAPTISATAPALASRELAPEALRSIDHVLWTLDISSQVCDALATVHAAGVLHRDLKPANIVMVEGRGPVITDFGTVHAPSRASYTQAAGFVGTPAYMSPEQANERELDRRSDLYSLAATIYHCLAGRSPFAERSLTAVLIALDRKDPEALRKINPAVPVAFARVIGKGMAKDVRDRFATVQEFSAALEKVRRGESLGRLWTVPGMYRRTRRWHLPVAVAIVLGLLWYLWRDPAAVIREMIVADELEQAVIELGQVPMEERAEVDATLRLELPDSRLESLMRVFAEVDGKGLVRVRKSSRYVAAIGPVDRFYQVHDYDLPASFQNLERSTLLPVEPGYSYLYIKDQSQTSAFSDGTRKVFYVPLHLDMQGLRDPILNVVDPADLPVSSFFDQVQLLGPREGEWIEIPAGAWSITVNEGKTENFTLRRPLIGHKFELPRSAAFHYRQWALVRNSRSKLFAHPDEPPDAMKALFEGFDDRIDSLRPLRVSFWAAFRIAGFLGGRLPSANEWLLAVQAGKGASLPEGTEESWPEQRRKSPIDWKIEKEWERSEFGFFNMHVWPGEWTTTQNMANRKNIEYEFRYCFFLFYMRDRTQPFVPNLMDSMTTNAPHGIRLFRDRFPR